MIDKFGRNVEYLRLSLTERCTLRCIYCRLEEGVCPKREELTINDFVRIAKACVDLGLIKIRLTGGEPLLRKDIIEIVRELSIIDGLQEVTMTTNGQMLAGKAKDLKQAGLKRVNISLDSLDPEKYRQISGGELNLVLAGIDESIQADLLPVKINVVLVMGRNDDEVDDFIALTKDKPVDVRFIELMPMGELGQAEELRVNNNDLISARLYLKPISRKYAGQPSSDYAIDGHLGHVGFISPISHRFCASCNRIRIMSDGTFRPCLGDNMEISLKNALKLGDLALFQTIHDAIYAKPAGHSFDKGFQSEKSMDRIGG